MLHAWDQYILFECGVGIIRVDQFAEAIWKGARTIQSGRDAISEEFAMDGNSLATSLWMGSARLSWVTRIDRHREVKDGATVLGGRPQPPLMRLDDCPADR